ncbi:MAG: hypothetical protein ACXVEC_13105 [Nocardioides sp.]
MTEGTSPDRLDLVREIMEAQRACDRAVDSCRAAAAKLGSAKAWGTYDTWFGGGLLASMVKHDRIDEAQALLRDVDASLDRLRSELADIGMEGVGDIGISETLRAMDVWFDNIVSDAMTQSRLRSADERLASVGAALERLRTELARRREQAERS